MCNTVQTFFYNELVRFMENMIVFFSLPALSKFIVFLETVMHCSESRTIVLVIFTSLESLLLEPVKEQQ